MKLLTEVKAIELQPGDRVVFRTRMEGPGVYVAKATVETTVVVDRGVQIHWVGEKYRTTVPEDYTFQKEAG